LGERDPFTGKNHATNWPRPPQRYAGCPPDGDATNRTRLGFDLAARHNFLLNDDKLSQEYTFDCAWKAVKQRIDELLDHPDRVRLVRPLEERPEAAADMRWSAHRFCLGGFVYLWFFSFLYE
jgi:hypothetical protein